MVKVVCIVLYVLNLYLALSQKRSNDGRVCYDLHYLQNEGNAKFLENWAVGCGANQSWKTIPSVRGIVGERPHQQLSVCGEWFHVSSSSPLSGNRPPRQSSARSLTNINSECPSR
jgi:hypothetical protein